MHAPKLLTIPFSHYCEKARWALQRAQLSFEERRYLPVVHYTATLRAGGGKTVPVLVTDDGVLTESTDILRWVSARVGGQLYPKDVEEDVVALEQLFDNVLGPATRRWNYGRMTRHRAFARSFFGGGVEGWQRASLPLTAPILGLGVRVRYRATPTQVERAAKQTFEVFDNVARRLADGRRYLTGERFTAADLTFAALSSPAVIPPEYGCPLPAFETWPAAMIEPLKQFREHPGGAYALRLYAEDRAVVSEQSPRRASLI